MLGSYLAMMLFISCIVAHFQIEGEDTGYNDDNYLN